MPRRPLIGVTANPGGAGVLEGLMHCPRAYVDAIAAAGATPILLPPLMDVSSQSVATVVDRLDGLLLSGGRDVHPCRYGQAAHPACELLDPRRDAWDMQLLECALARRGLPILGICLGIQQLNVALGGTLVQHVPDLQGDLEHRAPPTGDRFHAVSVTPGTRLASILGAGMAEVTTRHHQAVARPGRGAVPVARAPDGLIEAIEGLDQSRFLVGVQWHPERNPDSPASRALFAAFVAACAAVAAPSRGASVSELQPR